MTDVARRFDLPKQTVSRFKATIAPYLLENSTEQRERLGNLLLSCLESNFTALEAMARTCTTAEALAATPVRDICALHHEISDVLLRLLEIAWTSGAWEADRQRGAQALPAGADQ